jgi:hypothetical protein
LAREPTAAEQAEILRFLEAEARWTEVSTSPSSDQSTDRQVWISVCQAVLAGNEFRHVK